MQPGDTIYVYPDIPLSEPLLEALAYEYPEVVQRIREAGIRTAGLRGWKPNREASVDWRYRHRLLLPESLLPPRPTGPGETRDLSPFSVCIDHEGPVLTIGSSVERLLAVHRERTHLKLLPIHTGELKKGWEGYLDTVIFAREDKAKLDDPPLLPCKIEDQRAFIVMVSVADGRHALLDIDDARANNYLYRRDSGGTEGASPASAAAG